MARMSNNLIGLLNLLTFILSVPILVVGIWLAHRGSTDCEQFLVKPVIVLGSIMMLVSLAGLIGAFYRVSWLLWVYLLVMFLLIVLLFCFTIFTFVVTRKGDGRAVFGKGYKEYWLGDYSHWLQKRVNNYKNWNKITSCLIKGNVCSRFSNKYLHDTVERFYTEKLSPLQSGCCKPPDVCNFTYVSPTVWIKPTSTFYFNPDCSAWSNNHYVLCYNCQSCKAGLLQTIKMDWKKVAMVNIVFLVFLIIVYSVGCHAFRNNREDNYYGGYE